MRAEDLFAAFFGGGMAQDKFAVLAGTTYDSRIE